MLDILFKSYWTVLRKQQSQFSLCSYLRECCRASKERQQLALLNADQLKDIGITEAERDRECQRGALLTIEEFEQRKWTQGSRWV